MVGDCLHAARLMHIQDARGWLSAAREMAGGGFCRQQAQLRVTPG